MKEKVSLKRISRRCQSESAKEQQQASTPASNNNNNRLFRDGKEICPIPLIQCPGNRVIKEDPEKSVKMLCSNQSCPFTANSFVHMDCFKQLEEKMYTLLKHQGHKTSNWTDSQIRQNLWDRKGLTLIQTQLRCPCNAGISLRDEDEWVRREPIIQRNDKKRKSKKNTLPSVVTRVKCESESAPPQYDVHVLAEKLDAMKLSSSAKLRIEKEKPAPKIPPKKSLSSHFNVSIPLPDSKPDVFPTIHKYGKDSILPFDTVKLTRISKKIDDITPSIPKSSVNDVSMMKRWYQKDDSNSKSSIANDVLPMKRWHQKDVSLMFKKSNEKLSEALCSSSMLNKSDEKLSGLLSSSAMTKYSNETFSSMGSRLTSGVFSLSSSAGSSSLFSSDYEHDGEYHLF